MVQKWFFEQRTLRDGRDSAAQSGKKDLSLLLVQLGFVEGQLRVQVFGVKLVLVQLCFRIVDLGLTIPLQIFMCFV